MAKRSLRIFVSATTADLGSYRTAVRDELLHRDGVIPILQDHFSPTYRTVQQELFGKIQPCDAVICLIGCVYGEEPPGRSPAQPRESYTQMEYRVAKKLGKPVYLFIAKETCAWDQPIKQDPDEQQLQSAYRDKLRQGAALYGSFSDRDDLTQQVGRIDFDSLRPSRPWFWPSVILGLLIAILALSALFLPPGSSQIPLSLDMPGNYKPGQSMELMVTSHRAGYLYLGAVWADGSVYLLYPNFHSPRNGDNLVKAGQTLHLPADLPPATNGQVIAYPMEFPQGLPADQNQVTERIFAFITAELLQLPDTDADLGPGFRKLGVLRDPSSFSPDSPPDRLEFQNWNLPLGKTGVVVKSYTLNRQ
jgi:hypothetical protein